MALTNRFTDICFLDRKKIILCLGGDDESETGQSVGLAGFYVNGVWIPFIDELTAKKSFILLVFFAIFINFIDYFEEFEKH